MNIPRSEIVSPEREPEDESDYPWNMAILRVRRAIS